MTHVAASLSGFDQQIMKLTLKEPFKIEKFLLIHSVSLSRYPMKPLSSGASSNLNHLILEYCLEEKQIVICSL
jgi:hypothetical protein